MFGVENFGVFLFTALLFIVTPGLDTVFVLNKSVGQGRKAGVYSTLGVNSGVLVHTVFAALGLSLLLARSAVAFSVVKYLGAAYLLFLGTRALLSKESKLDFTQAAATGAESGWKSFRVGFFTNILNPKVALFFLSFFPQFIRKSAAGSPVPFIVLGLSCAVLGFIWFLTLSYFAALFSVKLKQHPAFGRYMNKCSGIIFILMGIKVALARK